MISLVWLVSSPIPHVGLSNPLSLSAALTSSLASVALDDFSACVVDAAGRRVVRRFAGHAGPLTDLCLSPDGAWLLTAGMDCCVRVWSLPQAALVDVLRTDAAPTSVTLGPAGRLLATTHVDDAGVYLWANRTLFDYVSLPPLPADHVPSVAPAPGSAPDDGVVLTAADEPDQQADVKLDLEEEYACRQQLADQLVTLSLLPESRWAHLLNVDAILVSGSGRPPPLAGGRVLSLSERERDERVVGVAIADFETHVRNWGKGIFIYLSGRTDD